MSDSAPISIDDLTAEPLPVFAHSVRSMLKLRDEKSVQWKYYGDIILKDPGLVLQTLKQLHASSKKPRAQEVAGMEQAAMLLGLDQVQGLPGSCPQVEKVLPAFARQGYQRATVRAFHAAYQAWDWAFIRHDINPDEMLLSALLHDAAELALWVNAPDRIHRIRRLTIRDKMPAAEAQYIALGNSLEHFGRRLAERWHLPQLAHEALRPEYNNEERVRGVILAVQLARQTEWGWYSPEVEATLTEIAEYLDSSLEETTVHIHRAAVRAAREADFYGACLPAAMLPRIDGDAQWLIDEEFPPETDEPATAATSTEGIVCLTPQPQTFNTIVQELEAGRGHLEINEILRKALHGMHDGAGLNRALFAMLSTDRQFLMARFLVGSDNDPEFNRFRISLGKPHLFKRLMDKPQSLRIHAENREKFWGLVPDNIKRLIGTDSFCAQSVFIDGKPVGLFYADRHSPACDIDETTYKRFRQLCQLAARALAARTQQRD